MKIEYTCEVCGNRFATQSEAEECEKSHYAQKKREELRDKSIKAISGLYEKHMKEFGEVPELALSNEGMELAKKYAAEKLTDLIGDLADDIVAPLWLSYYSLLIKRSRSKYEGDNVKITNEDIGEVVESVSKCFSVSLAFNAYHPAKTDDNPKPSVSRKVSMYSSWKEESKKFYVY